MMASVRKAVFHPVIPLQKTRIWYWMLGYDPRKNDPTDDKKRPDERFLLKYQLVYLQANHRLMALTAVNHRLRRLAEQDALGAILNAVERQRLLLAAVQARLAPPLDQHCRYADLEKGRLTLVTDSSVWGARLRFLAPELITSLRETHGEIKECRVRVQPTCLPTPSLAQAHPVIRMSPAAANLLLAAAEAQGETELGLALRRLAEAGIRAGDRHEDPGER
jgi:hypothetical protein